MTIKKQLKNNQMKIKFGIFIVLVSMIAITCKQDDSVERDLNSADAAAIVDTITGGGSHVKKDTQNIWKVSIGLMPDIQYKGSGVRAFEIKPDKPAAKAGLKAGDVVIELDGLPVKTLQEYTMYVSKFKKGDFVEMTIIRDKQTIKKKINF